MGHDASKSQVVSERLVNGAEIGALALNGSSFQILDAPDNTSGKLPVMHRADFADGASSNVDIVLTHATRVVDVMVIKTDGAGGAGDTIQIQTAGGANNVSDAIDINIADQTTARAGTIDDAFQDFAAAATLRVARVKASGANAAAEVYVIGFRNA